MKTYDVMVLGGGPAGYVAATEAGKAGKTVLLVEEKHEGGVCLNAGCIPTKTLLYTSKFYHHLKNNDVHGIKAIENEIDWLGALAWKNEVITTYRKGVISLLRSAKVETVMGRGVLVDRSTIEVEGIRYQGQSVIIATGSRPAVPPIAGLKDNAAVCTSTELLHKETLPSHLVVIGGGVIGLEFAAMFAQLGVEVTVLEMLPQVVPLLEPEIRKTLLRSLKDIKIEVNARVVSVDGATVHYEKAGTAFRVEADTILVATGRKANIDGIGLKEAGVKTKDGYILVNNRMETSAPRVYAVGDVVGTSLFAHSASRMAEVAVKVLLGDRSSEMTYHAIPWALYTWPEVAGCGYTEEEALAKGLDVVSATALMRLSARYYAENGNTPGMVKVVVRKDDKTIVGIQMVGGTCSEMIWGATMAVQLHLSVEQVVETIFPHPTIGEVLREVLLQLQ